MGLELTMYGTDAGGRGDSIVAGLLASRARCWIKGIDRELHIALLVPSRQQARQIVECLSEWLEGGCDELGNEPTRK